MKATKPNQHQIKSTLMPTSLALQHNDNEYASPTLYTICINNTSSQGYTTPLHRLGYDENLFPSSFPHKKNANLG